MASRYSWLLLPVVTFLVIGSGAHVSGLPDPEFVDQCIEAYDSGALVLSIHHVFDVPSKVVARDADVEQVVTGVMVWSPERHPAAGAGNMCCRKCGNTIAPYTWSNQYGRQGRRIYGLTGQVLLVTRVFKCINAYHCGNNFVYGTDRMFLEKVPVHSVPFILTYKSGFTLQLATMINAMIDENLPLASIGRIIRRQYLTILQGLLRDNDKMHNIRRDSLGPHYTMMSYFYVRWQELHLRSYYDNLMASIRNCRQVFTIDHTFKMPRRINCGREGKQHKPFDSLVTIMD